MLLKVPLSKLPQLSFPHPAATELLPVYASALGGVALTSNEELEQRIINTQRRNEPYSYYLLSTPELSADIRLSDAISRIEVTKVELSAARKTISAWRVSVIADSEHTQQQDLPLLDSYLESDRAVRIKQLQAHRIKLSCGYDAFRDALRDADIDAGEVDYGRGHYEYWGARGVDKDICPQIAECVGPIGTEFQTGSFPEIGGEFSGTKSAFIVTRRQYSAKLDEDVEDGYDHEFDLKGRMVSAVITPETLHIGGQKYKFYNVDASFEWAEA